MTDAEEQYLEVDELFRRMSDNICVVVASYYVWHTLTFSRSIPEVGQEKADNTARLMSSHKEFFIPTEQNHLQIFILGLMTFFDKGSKRSKPLSIENLIKKIQNNKEFFTPQIVRMVYPKLDEIGAITDDYIPIDQAIINDFNKIRTTHERLIKNLKIIRDKQIAHIDMTPIKHTTFVPNEIEILIQDVQKIFNKLSNKFNLSSTAFDYIKDGAIRATQSVLTTLGKGDAVFREERRCK